MNALVVSLSLQPFSSDAGSSYEGSQLVYRKITLMNAFVTSYSSAVDESTNVLTTTFMLKFLKRVDSTYPSKPGAQPAAQNTYDLLAKTVLT